MCGFVGYFGPTRHELESAAVAIEHRGPDMRGITHGRDWGVAFNRLSIIDLSEHGMQPFTFDDVTVYANGEIYNYIELQQRHADEYHCASGSDIEIVPFLYRKYGMDFLHMLNGMFSMVIIDGRSGKRYLVRDRFGKKPLFYCRNGADILFASEIKALKRVVPLRPDRTNIALNLSCWFLVQPLSLYEGVIQVNPGCYLEVDGNRATEHRWYAPRVQLVPNRSYEELRNEILELYRDSVAIRLRSDVPVGIYLSGGIDSISMAQLSREKSPRNFMALTARIKDKELWERNDTDTTVVHRYCAETGLPAVTVDVGFDFWNRNIARIVDNFDELFTDMGILIFYAMSEAAHRNGVKVLFSGVGGDEIFGGYPWQARLRELPSWLRKRGLGTRWLGRHTMMYRLLSSLRNPVTNNRAASLFQLATQTRVWHAQSLSAAFNPYMSDVYGAVAERLDQLSVGYYAEANRVASDDPVNAMNYANVFTVLGNQHFEVDIASMKYSVENRSPLQDYRLVELMLSVPDAAKIAGGPKALARNVLSDVVPPYVLQAKKSGPSMPLHVWLQDTAFRNVALGFLTRHRDLIGDVVSKDLAGHVGDPKFHSGSNGALMTFCLISLVIWAKQTFGSLKPDEDISFLELAGRAA